MLTRAQMDARQGKLTASRIAPLMTGDGAKIMQLYLEMTDQAEPDNLDDVWPVQLGSATEPLNLDWYERKNGVLLARRGEVVVHPRYQWAAATLDGWIPPDLDCPLETKHVGGREPLEVIVDRYQPQMQWQMEVTGAKECALSVIMGANEPVVEFVPRDADYAAEMIRRGAQFMDFVKRRIPPVALDPVPSPVDATKVYDMLGNNAWGDKAATWLATKSAADDCKDAEKVLKSMVPADAKKCAAYGVQITRDRAGRLSLREAQS
jgi:predicted phage-related endonuclease